MNKKIIERILSDDMGFKKRGNFYVGKCNNSVISGYCLDISPDTIYIWRFVLPVYDNVEFLHLTLGRRIVTLSKKSEETGERTDLLNFLHRDWSSFSEVNSCQSLVKHIDAEGLESTYALWVRYLTCVRCKEFETAERLESENDATSKFLQLPMISKHFADLTEVRKRGGWETCSNLLDEWHRKTAAAFC